MAISAKHSATEANGKLLNYMAAGLPTVACDGPVARENLGEAEAFVPPGDLSALAAACVRLLEDPGERKWHGLALRERAVDTFSWSAIADRLIEVYRDVQSGCAGKR